MYQNTMSFVYRLFVFTAEFITLYFFHYHIFPYTGKKKIYIGYHYAIYIIVAMLCNGLFWRESVNLLILFLFSPISLGLILKRKHALKEGCISFLYYIFFDILTYSFTSTIYLYILKNKELVPVVFLNWANQLVRFVLMMLISLITSKYIFYILNAGYPKPILISLFSLPIFSLIIDKFIGELQMLLDWKTNEVLVSNFVLARSRLISILIVAMNIFFLYFFSRTSIFVTAKLEKKQMEERISSLITMQKVKLEQQKSERQLIHDIQNIAIASQTEDSALHKYLDKIYDYDLWQYTGIAEIDSILSAKQAICDEHHLSLHVIPAVSALPEISYSEFATILGIALDNSIEEGIATTKAFSITVKITLKESVAVMAIENPITHPIQRNKAGQIRSAKGDKRGYGLAGIEFLTNSDNRQIAISTENEKFILKVMFWE